MQFYPFHLLKHLVKQKALEHGYFFYISKQVNSCSVKRCVFHSNRPIRMYTHDHMILHHHILSLTHYRTFCDLSFAQNVTVLLISSTCWRRLFRFIYTEVRPPWNNIIVQDTHFVTLNTIGKLPFFLYQYIFVCRRGSERHVFEIRSNVWHADMLANT